MKAKKLAIKDIKHIDRQYSLRSFGYYVESEVGFIYDKPESLAETVKYIYDNRLKVSIICYPANPVYFEVSGVLERVGDFYTLDGKGHAEFYQDNVRCISYYEMSEKIVITLNVK